MVVSKSNYSWTAANLNRIGAYQLHLCEKWDKPYFQLHFSINGLLILSPMLPEAVNEFAYPPRYWCDLPSLGKNAESSLFSLSSSTILCLTLMDANLFRARLNSLCCWSCCSVYGQSYIRWSHILKPQAVIFSALASSVCFVCLMIYSIENILSITNIYLSK